VARGRTGRQRREAEEEEQGEGRRGHCVASEE
jgi:hypothetical protein